MPQLFKESRPKPLTSRSRAETTTPLTSLVKAEEASASSNDADEERIGVKTLWPQEVVPGQSPADTSIDMIAVHGLGGDLYGTWEDNDTGRLWLRDFLPQDVTDAHIMTFGYNSGWAFSGSVARLDDFARALLEGLLVRRRRCKTQNNPIVFVCHGLGGIVFKKALVIAHEREDLYGTLLAFVKGVMFLGTPHRGSDFAYWGRTLGRIGTIGSATLGELRTQFVRRAVPLQIVTVYERQKIPGVSKLIVAKDSAVLNLPNERIIPVEADHLGMCKFRSKSGTRYETISNYINELVEYAKGTINPPREQPGLDPI